MDSVIQFLKYDILPEEKVETDKIRRKATSYWLSEDRKLYKRSFSGLICYVFIPSKPSHFWKRCMKESVEAILEADP